MANIFDKKINSEVLARLDNIRSDSERLWGEMTVAQMLLHCQKPMNVAEGKLQVKTGIQTYFIGGFSKYSFLKSDGFEKNLPTSPEFIVAHEPDFDKEKEILAEMIKQFGETGGAIILNNQHPFFGTMTADEWGILQYLHIDHHLQQFGA